MKKLLVSLLCVVMMVTFMPSMAFATVQAEQQTDGSIIKVVNGDKTQYCESLMEASEKASDGATLVLLKSFDSEKRLEITGKSVTLDLNGYTMSQTSSNAFIYAHNNGKVTIVDSSTAKSGKISALNGVLWIDGGAIDLQEGTVECTGYKDNNGKMVGNIAVEMKGSSTDMEGYSAFTMGENARISCIKETPDGQSISDGYVMIDNNGTNTAYGTKMDLKGTIDHALVYINGSVTATSGNVPVFNLYKTAAVDGGIYAAGYAKWNIMGAKITSFTGIEIRAGEMIISGEANITGTGTPVEVTPDGNGSTTVGAGLAIAQHATKLPINVKVESGIIEGYSALYQSNPQNNEQDSIDKVNIEVTGGTFKTINGGTVAVYSENKTGFISRGSFSKPISPKYCVAEVGPLVKNDGSCVVKAKKELTGNLSDDDGYYYESEEALKANYTAMLGTTAYKTLAEAIEKAGTTASTITLLKNTNENITIPETANVVLDLNGNVLSGGTATGKAAVTNNGTLIIKDSKGNGGVIKREDNGAQGYYTIDNQGTMTIESGRIENKTGPMPKGSSLIRNAGGNKEATLNIQGGEIYQDGFIAVKNDDQGILNITGGKISTSGDTATHTASAVQNWSEAVISGGEINGTVWTGTWSKDFPNSKTEIKGNAVISGQITARVEGNEAGEMKPVVEISGGTLNVPKWSVGKDGSTVSITGGKLNYGDGTVMNCISDTADKKVTIVLKENTKITHEKSGEVVFEAPAGVKVENGTSDITITVITPSGTFEVEPNKDITSQNPYIPPTTPVQKPTIEAEEGATVTLSKDGTTATIVVDKDATLKDVLLNGESLGAVTEVKDLKTGDKLVVIVETAAEKNARLKAGVENTTIKLYYNKKEIGKGWIKLRYKKSYGYKVDNYEIFRSAKKKTNFGDEAWFVTKTNKTKGFYKNSKSVKKGTRYYYKMRGVREIAGETVYTKWSNIVMRTGR